MTHEEKAKELIALFWAEVPHSDIVSRRVAIFEQSKKFALIAVDEILKSVSVKKTLYLTDMTYQIYSYWSNVKEELENMKV